MNTHTEYGAVACKLHMTIIGMWLTSDLKMTCTNPITEWLQHRNRQQYKQRHHRGGRLLMVQVNSFVNHFWINAWHNNTQNKRCKSFTVQHTVQTTVQCYYGKSSSSSSPISWQVPDLALSLDVPVCWRERERDREREREREKEREKECVCVCVWMCKHMYISVNTRDLVHKH